MESALIISPPTAFESLMDNSVFPTAVGPVIMIKGRFSISRFLSFSIARFAIFKHFLVLMINPVQQSYTIRLNFFSSSYLLMAIIVGRPCGQA